MRLQAYLAQQCATNGIRRGQIPSLLGFSNSAKALRRYDRLLQGGLEDVDLVARIRACPLLAGERFDEVLEDTRRFIEASRREKALAAELRARAEFVPHLWVIHERSIPSPIFVVAMLGVDTFKRVELPEKIAAQTSTGQQLVDIAAMLNEGLRDKAYLCSPFGRPTHVLFRDTFDHAYVYDVQERRFTGEHHEPIRVGRALLKIK
ncbi:MAG: hypothetical protein FGM32_09420 [Candidatus Kapabacteria bacterium]|nr:hypothetical protein [Candidatus Kapabacteria bacterium]